MCKVFPVEMFFLLCIASVQSLSVVQPLIIALPLKKIFYLFYVANTAVLYAQSQILKSEKCFTRDK